MKILKWGLIGCATLLVIGYATTRPLQDFIEYWVAAHQFVGGEDPYSLVESLRLEHALGWSKSLPIVALNPPWTLPLIAPLGVFRSYALAWTLWVGLLTFLAWWCTKVLLRLYSNGTRLFPAETAASEGILAFTFYPTLLCIGSAQVTILVLLGLTGFLWFVTHKQYVRSGACLGLAAIKPQLVYLLWFALVLWCWRKRKLGIVVSLGASIFGLLGAAMLVRPALLSDYWRFSQSGYVKIWPSAVGAILRYPFDSVRSFPLQFVAPILGTGWFLLHWRKHADSWDWRDRTPLLVAASVLTAPYGWTLDQVVLLIPIVAIAARCVSTDGKIPERVGWAYTGLNVALVLSSIPGPAAAYVLAPFAMTLVLLNRKQTSSTHPGSVDVLTVTT